MSSLIRVSNTVAACWAQVFCRWLMRLPQFDAVELSAHVREVMGTAT